MDKLDQFINGELAKKIISIILLAVFLYFLRGMLNQFLLIFMVTFIFGQLQKFIYDKINKYIKISRKLVTILMYLIFLLIFIITMIAYIPKVTQQLIDVINLISTFDLNQLKNYDRFNLLSSIPEDQISDYIRMAESHLLDFVTTAGTFSINILLSLLISFLFLLEKEEIIAFFKHMEHSKVSFLYQYFTFYGKKFLNCFWAFPCLCSYWIF